LRGCHRQIFRPRHQLPKFSNDLRGHTDVRVRFDSQLIWQAPEGYVECTNAFWAYIALWPPIEHIIQSLDHLIGCHNGRSPSYARSPSKTLENEKDLMNDD
jgi:hypothetical protein